MLNESYFTTYRLYTYVELVIIPEARIIIPFRYTSRIISKVKRLVVLSEALCGGRLLLLASAAGLPVHPLGHPQHQRGRQHLPGGGGGGGGDGHSTHSMGWGVMGYRYSHRVCELQSCVFQASKLLEFKTVLIVYNPSDYMYMHHYKYLYTTTYI